MSGILCPEKRDKLESDDLRTDLKYGSDIISRALEIQDSAALHCRLTCVWEGEEDGGLNRRNWKRKVEEESQEV